MSVNMDRLVAVVAETRGVAASAVAALSAIPQLIRDAIAADNASEDGELGALATDLEASIAPLAGALAQNPGPTDPTPPATGNDTAQAGEGADSVAESAGVGDSLTGGAADDAVSEG